ncbi:hypothetical protein [Nocardioides sp. Root151]|uniref:hypothetical protein n=1 Tax=Nocardioides sp. Root151 TaxID=1736475 RepID=UPI000703489A|nr:hypothetical protein [Nocardioides sp. Root151]KQZ68825.1 hypothetical protein ASD66_16330 [Nocardioides sp. Root151]
MTVSFSEHLDLLDLHGRAGAASLGLLQPDDRLPPASTTVRQAVADHWATLEIWAWSLENPDDHWSRRDDVDAPSVHAELVAGIAAELGRLETALRAAGPDTTLDYFGRPGTTAEVARLLAHEAITVAHAASLTAGRATPPLTAEVAADGIDRALGHWAAPEAEVQWLPEIVEIRTSDTGEAWHVGLSWPENVMPAEMRLVSPEAPAVVVEGPAVDVHWWLHGHDLANEAVTVSGVPEVARVLGSALLHPVPEAPRRRRWFSRR